MNLYDFHPNFPESNICIHMMPLKAPTNATVTSLLILHILYAW